MSKRIPPITGQTGPMRRELSGANALLRAMLFSSIYDSVYMPDERNPADIKNAATRRHYIWKRDASIKNQADARDFIRTTSPSFTSSTMGFGHVWSMLEALGSIRWDSSSFVENMELLWRAVDKDPRVGKRITTILQGVQQEAESQRITIDRSQEFTEMKESAV